MLGVGTLTLVSPAKRRDLPNSVTRTERGKPVRAFFNNEQSIHHICRETDMVLRYVLRTRRSARDASPVQVEEDGKSECPPVMGGIRDETIALT